MKTKILLTLLLFPLFFAPVSGQKSTYYYENAVFNENIKTVQMFRGGYELSNPEYQLGEDVKLVLKFDDLSGEPKNYFYTVIHCDANWNESFIRQDEYLEGFTDNPVDDYAMSFNTTFKFVNYRIEIPNDQVSPKLSGNYILAVFEDNDKSKMILTRRFYVVDPKVKVDATVRRATLDAFKGENHEVDFTIYHENFKIENPRSDVKVVVMQNGRWDNAIKDLKPLYVNPNSLVYDYDRENVFPAGNEFRYFDIRTNRLNGEGVFNIEFHRPYYHVNLVPDAPRANKKYFSYREMNGKYVVESQDRVEDYDLDCDYVFVHFALNLESVLLGGTVNVFGGLTDWNINKGDEMTWNFAEGRYELALLLKQGYYNYQYVYVENGSPKANHTNIEGSFWETENDYQIFVYYKDFRGRYDQLIGYQQLNSR